MFWLIVGVLVALGLVNYFCEENPSFREIVCIVIAIAYPIISFFFNEDEQFVVIVVGALILSVYKYLYAIPDAMDNDEPNDFLMALARSLSPSESEFVIVVICIVVCVVFAIITLLPTLICILIGSKFLYYISLFVPAVYCLVTGIPVISENY